MALLLLVEVVRTAAVRAFGEDRPALAAAFMPGDPSVQTQLGMTQIALAARSGKPVQPSVLSSIYGASARAPLAPEPFLVRGVEAQLAGNQQLAMRAFVAARWRDARSLPARYFLADAYFRAGDTSRGLAEIGALARLEPQGSATLAPYLAAYARNRATWPALRRLFADEPMLESATLIALAENPQTAGAVLPLASPGRITATQLWFIPLMQTLTGAGNYEQARRDWAAVSGVDLARAGPLFDPQFTDDSAPPPFNWSLGSSSVGVSERKPGGGLHLIAYGHDQGSLASQLLLLQPGAYRIGLDAPGFAPTGGMIRLSVTCSGSNAGLLSVPLDQLVQRDASFSVPAGCPAQTLAIEGTVSDMPQQHEVTIRAIRLSREQARG